VTAAAPGKSAEIDCLSGIVRFCRQASPGFRRWMQQLDMRTAVEITQGFARYAPEDPVRYDFALTRPGIRKDLNTGDRILSAL